MRSRFAGRILFLFCVISKSAQIEKDHGQRCAGHGRKRPSDAQPQNKILRSWGLGGYPQQAAPEAEWLSSGIACYNMLSLPKIVSKGTTVQQLGPDEHPHLGKNPEHRGCSFLSNKGRFFFINSHSQIRITVQPLCSKSAVTSLS